jgi:inositol transporter-like SP family MFS transporter
MSHPSDPVPPLASESVAITRQQWKWSALAGMASYLDAGSIVALGAGLALFQIEFGMSNTAVGTLAAIGPNALGCAIGAFLGGWLGDKLGRKRIYQYDLIVYAIGILLMAFSQNKEMLFAGTFIVGLAVGADVPTSLALVGEFAPDKARGKLLGFTQIAWCLGPVIVLLLAAALSSFGLLGIRIILLHLFVVAFVTWAMRRGLTESIRWKDAKKAYDIAPSKKNNLAMLFSGANLKALIWTTTIYLFWNLAAGTAGAFNSYLIKMNAGGSQTEATIMPCVAFITAMIFTVAVFMKFSDRSFAARKTMWGIGAIVQIVAYALFMVLPFSIPVVFVNILMFSAGGALAGEAFYKVFSQELFPTMIRGTAQGFSFAAARVAVGIWSFFVPIVADISLPLLGGILAGSLFISGAVGYFFMPDTSGKSLEQIENERGTTAPFPAR